MIQKMIRGQVVRKLLDEKLVKAGEKALDLGCGDGKDAIALAEAGLLVTAIDSNQSKIDFLMQKVKEAGLNTINARVADIAEFNFENEKYSLIIASNSLPFLASQEQSKSVIEKSALSLEPGGVLYFTVFGNRDAWAQKPQMNFFTRDEIFDFLNSLSIVDIYHTTSEEGFGLTMKGDIKYWHIFKFFVKRK